MAVNPPATFSHTSLEGSAVLAITGELDLANEEQLETALNKGLARNQPRLIVNLLQTTYADSTCLHALLRALDSARSANKKLTVVIKKRSGLNHIFEIMSMFDVLNVSYSMANAMAKKERKRKH